MYNDILILLTEKFTVDDTGELIKKTEEREVYAKTLSIGQTEFYQAQANGLKPELKFEIADYADYQNEKEVIYENTKYQVLKTYRKGIPLEITVHGGVHNGSA